MTNQKLSSLVKAFPFATIFLNERKIDYCCGGTHMLYESIEAAGYENILTKSLGSDCLTNIVWATIQGLSQLKKAEQIAADRGLDVSDVL